MEAKLAEYRARKRKEETGFSVRVNNALKNVKNVFQRTSSSSQQVSEPMDDAVQTTRVRKKEESVAEDDNIDVEPEVPEDPVMKKVFLVLKLVLWLALWGIFVELQFGAVYFVCSMFLFIYLGTRTNRKRSEPSAYSVFNQNCERIQGTYTAEQFESQLLHRPPPLNQNS